MKNTEGMELERLAHKFVWNLGYLPQSRARLWFEDVEEQTTKLRFEGATDIDVLGFHYDPFLQESRMMIDCKHESEGVLSQLLRCTGLRYAFNLNHVLILRTKAGSRHRAFADARGLRLMQINHFIELISKYDDLGSFLWSSYEKVEAMNNDLPREFKSSVAFPLDNTLLTIDPFRRIKELASIINYGVAQTPDNEITSASMTPRKWILFRAFSELARSTVEISGRLISAPPSQLKHDLQVRLIEDVEFKKAILQKIQTATDQPLSATGGTIPIAELAPTYTDRLYEAIKLEIANCRKANSFLRLLDLILHQFILMDKPTDLEWAASTLYLKKHDTEEFIAWIQSMTSSLSTINGASELFSPLL